MTRSAAPRLQMRSKVFERPHHQRIATLLTALNARLLRDNDCLFGGGTAIALLHGEFRESVDVDFLVSDLIGYSRLRQRLTGRDGFGAILRKRAAAIPAREVRADQYGVRTLLEIDGAPIKFEIVLEARFQLDVPGPADEVCGIATLTRLDRVTSKLLANADRWADDGVFSRDLIDLAMIAPPLTLLRAAITKAQAPYGAAVRADVLKAVAQLAARPGRLERCMQALDVRCPRAVLWQKIRALERGVQRAAPP